MLNVVIPMAGRGSRFADAGYEIPKPLPPIHGVPMIEVVVRNLPRTSRRASSSCAGPSMRPSTRSSPRCARSRRAARS